MLLGPGIGHHGTGYGASWDTIWAPWLHLATLDTTPGTLLYLPEGPLLSTGRWGSNTQIYPR